MNATAKDLRFHSSELLETVNRGEEVVITRHGKPCARLVPFSAAAQKTGINELFGIWRDDDATQDVGEYVRKLRKGRF
jgi:prevent-host-death family protein